MRNPAPDDRAMQEFLLGARLTAHVARQFRPACVGVRVRNFRAFVAALVAAQMQRYAAHPPS